ncbi:MAG: hypothetical protein AB1Z57_02880, partial [Acidimicrobiia bacterium]
MPRTARQSTVQVLGALLALGVIVLLVWTTTTAAFIGQTDNTGNGFSTGSVVLEDDDGTDALFDVLGPSGAMAPGDTVSGCIEVEYTGSITTGLTTVDLFGSGLVAGDTLADDLTVSVWESNAGANTGNTFNDCSGFLKTQASEIVSAVPLSTFGAGTPVYAGTWSPSATNQTRTYLVEVTLSDSPQVDSEGKTAEVVFNWQV